MENNALSLPQNIPAENATIGSVLISPDTYFDVADILVADDFYLHKNRFIWDAIVALAKSKTPIDLITLTDQVDRQGQLAEIGGAAYLTRLLNEVGSSLNVGAYARLVKDTSTRRKLIVAAQKALGYAENENISALEAVESVQRDLANLQIGAADTDIETIGDILRRYDESKDKGEALEVFRAKSPDINRILGGGLWSSRLVLIGGIPKIGKTVLCQRIITEIAANGTPCLFISQEMSKRDLIIRAIAAHQIPEDKLMRVDVSGYERQYDEAMAVLESLPLFVSQKTRWSITALRAEVMRRVREDKIRVLLIDHVRLLADNPNKPRDDEYKQLEWKTEELKNLAKDADIAILAIYTMNKAGEFSGGNNPIHNIDLGLALVTDQIYQEILPTMERKTPDHNKIWLMDFYRRYGRFEAAAEFRKDDNYPIIHDAFIPRGQ